MIDTKETNPPDPVHERALNIRTYPLAENRVLVEGWLRDERFINIHRWTGEEQAPGVVHWMVVRLVVGGWPLTIIEAEAEMPGVPHELCRQTQDSVRTVIGLNIASGYTDEVRRRLGGVAGCAHLTHLLMVMGPAALHGIWTHFAREPRPRPKTIEDIPGLNLLLGSCRLWAPDGPFMEMIRAELADKG